MALAITGVRGMEELIMASMRQVRIATLAAGWLLTAITSPHAEQLSTGEPHKWVAVSDKSMYDFVANGFELKAVVYDTSAIGPHADSPDVHYFLQKNTDLIRCDFRKRDQTSYYWCYKLSQVK
jgi:hypothetical protein